MNNKQRIEILNNPQLLINANVKEEEYQYTDDEASLIKIILESVSKSIDSNRISDAEKLLDQLDSLKIHHSNDSLGWIYFYKARVLEEKGSLDQAIETYLKSTEFHSNCWSHYKIGKLYEKRDPLKAYEHYSKSLDCESNLSAEANAFVERWITSFYDEKIYKRYNSELANSGHDLKKHYLQYGYNEGRIGGVARLEDFLQSIKAQLKKDFNWKSYLDANPDLASLITSESDFTLLEAEYVLTKHFISHGLSENREWKSNNHDLARCPESYYNEQKEFVARLSAVSLGRFLKRNRKITLGSSNKNSECLITIILVLFNKAELTLNALLSIESSGVNDICVIIVDNNSSDQTQALLQKVQGNISIIRNTQNLHFLRSVNLALGQVKTKYVALLNNDAMLHQDALGESLSCIKRYSDNAIVGGMILHYDGYIQDAGSIVFSDGSCKGLGRRQLPNNHLYNFERSVDYLSGAYLFTSLSTVQRLGGFDENFAPAYYEETDLCFRAQANSIPVIYNPNIIVKHLEFGSSQKSEEAFRLMEINRERFRAIHDSKLNSHLSPALFKDDMIECVMHGHIDKRPKILIIEDRIPRSFLGSGFSRSSELVSVFGNYAAHVTIYATDYLRSRVTSHGAFPTVECIESDREYLKEILLNRSAFYDLIFVTREHNQELFSQIKHELNAEGIYLKAKIAYDAESLFSIRDYTKAYLEQNNDHIRDINGIDLSRIVSTELERFRDADLVSTVSFFEKDIISKIYPSKRIVYLGHPFRPLDERLQFDVLKRKKLVFLAAIHEKNSPNHDSLEWLCKDILPALSSRDISDLRVEIGGNISCKASLDLIELMASDYGFFNYRGMVDNLDDFFAQAMLFLAPTRFAAGAPHKVHMASSYGIPTITTSLIAQQMRWDRNGAILIADDPEQFASAIEMAYKSPDLLLDCRDKMICAFNHECSDRLFEANIKDILEIA